MDANFLKKVTNFSFSIFLLLSLPACWGPSEDVSVHATTEKETLEKEIDTTLTGEVVVTMGGKAIVTTDSLQAEKDKLINANPQFKAMLTFMDPKQFDRNLSDGLTNQAIVDRYIVENGIDKQASYQKELQDGYKAVERMISTKYFSETFTVSVSDKEAQDFYEKNKDVMPQLIVAQGGVEAVGIEFDTKKEADAFLKKVIAGTNLQTVAEKEGLQDKIKDFKMVTQQSIGVDPKIKERVLGFTSCPTVEIVTLNETTHVVVQGLSKKDPEYRPFAQVKEDIKAYLEKEKQAEEFDKAIDVLKSTYDVQTNEDYFGGDDTEQVALYEADKEDELQAA